MVERTKSGSWRLAARSAWIAGAAATVALAMWIGRDIDISRFAFLDAGALSTGGTAAEAAMSASAQSRRIGPIHAEAEAFWKRELGNAWTPSETVFFSRSMASPCAGRGGVTGHFRCAADRVAGYDIVLAAETGRRLREAADPGQALMVGRMVAGAARDVALPDGRDPVLGGDCMAGVWAGSALGGVDAGFYARVLTAARRSADALVVRGPDAPIPLNEFARGDPTDRDAAFRAGIMAGSLKTCAAF